MERRERLARSGGHTIVIAAPFDDSKVQALADQSLIEQSLSNATPIVNSFASRGKTRHTASEVRTRATIRRKAKDGDDARPRLGVCACNPQKNVLKLREIAHRPPKLALGEVRPAMPREANGAALPRHTPTP